MIISGLIGSTLLANVLHSRVLPACSFRSLFFRIFGLYLFAYYVIFKLILWQYFLSPLRKIPGPKGNIVLGQMRAIIKEDSAVPHMRWLKEYPDTPFIRYTGLWGAERVMVSSSKAFQHILQNAYNYPKPPDMSEGLRRILGAKGILFAEGDVHRRQRKQMNPAFSYSNMKNIVPIFWEKAQILTDLWFEEFERSSDGKVEIEVLSGLSRATLDIIGSAGLGYDIDSLHTETNELAIAYQDIFSSKNQNKFLAVLAFYAPWTRDIPFKRHRDLNNDQAIIQKTSKKVVEAKVEACRRGEDIGDDILALLVRDNMAKEKANDPEDPAMTTDEISDQTMTLLAAGHETTSAATTWALHLLSKHQDVQEKLRREIIDTFGDDVSMVPTFERIEGMHYLGNFVKEVLRFLPPVPMTRRQAMVDAVIEGQEIPKGTQILVVIAATNKAVSFWGADAELFDPDRWDNLPPTHNNYAMETFLHGPRSCIGQRFATVEMKSLLISILQRFKIEEKPGHIVEVQSSITSRPKGGLPLIFTSA